MSKSNSQELAAIREEALMILTAERTQSRLDTEWVIDFLGSIICPGQSHNEPTGWDAVKEAFAKV